MSERPRAVSGRARAIGAAAAASIVGAGTLATVILEEATPPPEAIPLAHVTSKQLIVHFVDVGVGDGILIELPDRSHEVVIDGGDRRHGHSFAEYVEPYVQDPVELAVMTHADFDHWSGVEVLLDRHPITELWDAGYDRECKFTGTDAQAKRAGDQYLGFLKTLPRPGMTLRRGGGRSPAVPLVADPVRPQFELDGARFWILHVDPDPPDGECSYIVNDASVVVRMQYKDVVFLFTGDANGKERDDPADVEPTHVEAKLLALESAHPGILSADVLKVPHHGSETASTRRFIEAVAPRFAVISSSVTASYRLPAKRVLQLYQRIRFDRTRKIEKVLRTNHGEASFETRKFGDDHVICATNGNPADVVCDYAWRFEE
jgi:beta-lactamase superfamily II metal-dependent hydrolase